MLDALFNIMMNSNEYDILVFDALVRTLKDFICQSEEPLILNGLSSSLFILKSLRNSWNIPVFTEKQVSFKTPK